MNMYVGSIIAYTLFFQNKLDYREIIPRTKTTRYIRIVMDECKSSSPQVYAAMKKEGHSDGVCCPKIRKMARTTLTRSFCEVQASNERRDHNLSIDKTISRLITRATIILYNEVHT